MLCQRAALHCLPLFRQAVGFLLFLQPCFFQPAGGFPLLFFSLCLLSAVFVGQLHLLGGGAFFLGYGLQLTHALLPGFAGFPHAVHPFDELRITALPGYAHGFKHLPQLADFVMNVAALHSLFNAAQPFIKLYLQGFPFLIRGHIHAEDVFKIPELFFQGIGHFLRFSLCPVLGTTVGSIGAVGFGFIYGLNLCGLHLFSSSLAPDGFGFANLAHGLGQLNACHLCIIGGLCSNAAAFLCCTGLHIGSTPGGLFLLGKLLPFLAHCVKVPLPACQCVVSVHAGKLLHLFPVLH